jgi:hypothetical protein
VNRTTEFGERTNKTAVKAAIEELEVRDSISKALDIHDAQWVWQMTLAITRVR